MCSDATPDLSPDYGKPRPILTATNRPFWEATRRHEFLLQRCERCGAWIYPISVACLSCGAVGAYRWEAPSGRARLSSWAVYRQAFPPFTDADLPYAVAEVELEEGMRLIAQLVGVAISEYEAGMALRVAFRDVAPDLTLVVFRPA